MTEVQFYGADTLIISIFVLYLGNYLTRKFGFLQKYSIPQAVTGGLIVSVLVLVVVSLGRPGTQSRKIILCIMCLVWPNFRIW